LIPPATTSRVSKDFPVREKKVVLPSFVNDEVDFQIDLGFYIILLIVSFCFWSFCAF
jgi:hypothetical protein